MTTRTSPQTRNTQKPAQTPAQNAKPLSKRETSLAQLSALLRAPRGKK